MKSDEANDAAWEAAKGAVSGATKWGAGAALLGVIGHYWSPVYRATTIQFKVYARKLGRTDFFQKFTMLMGVLDIFRCLA
jgi:hypothetical protein